MKSLFETYNEYFPIGAAVNTRTIKTHADILKKHFNSITAENEMKPLPTHPLKDKYTFEAGNLIADFARQNNMQLRGHTLVWHNNSPDWFFEGKTKESAISKLQSHIKTVMDNFNYAYCWDVTNEVISDDKESGFLRQTPWLSALGEDYVEIAYRIARNVNKDVKLFYNDYNETNPMKRDRIYDLIKSVNKDKKLIDGFGLQGHWSIYQPDEDEICEAIEKYASLDIELQITELDVSLFRFEDRTKLDFPPQDLLNLQAEKYDNIFKIFRKYKKYITGVTLWGVADDESWLSYFPVKDRKNWPLLFDDNHKEKLAFEKVVEF